MNSIPAASRACCSRSIVDCFASAPFSMRVTVLAVTPAFLARSRTPQPTAARAIFSCIAFIGTLYKLGFTPYQKYDITWYTAPVQHYGSTSYADRECIDRGKFKRFAEK